ncbi:MAG: hypothetical protein ACTSRL_12345 [Candidatus Helarchaeota archaeon]
MPKDSFEEKMEISREIRENLIKAEQAMRDENLRNAAGHYKIAAELSNKLGHTEIANEYQKKANKLIGSLGEESSLKSLAESLVTTETTQETQPSPEPSSKEVASPSSLPTSDLIEDYVLRADKAIEAGKFSEAAKLYEEAARAVPQEAKRLLAEAIELRKKEKALLVTKKEVHRKTEHIQEYEETLLKIKEAIQNNRTQELVTLYGRAAVLAERVGKRQEAGEYRKAAIEAKRKVIQEMRTIPKNDRAILVKQYTEILKQIKHFLDEKMWQEAAEGYQKAAQLAYELEEYDNAKQLKEKAAKLQEQAILLAHRTELKERERALLEEIQTLDRDKEIDKILQNYESLTKIYEELEDEAGLSKIASELKEFKKIKKRKDILEQANHAIEQKDFQKALQLFEDALRISIDLGESKKAEGFRTIIEELRSKVDKITRDRTMIEQRSELLASAKAAIKEDPPNISLAINNYKEAARISFELGENQVANSYLQIAKKIEEDEGLLIERENFIKEAEIAIKKDKDFLLAAKFYDQAARFSEKLGDGTAEKYRKKAQALRELADEF